MIEDHRHRILDAAARVYAQHGWRGATTRRIAEEAGVNEVTIFRHFGSKDALLDEAIVSARAEQATLLTKEPVAPETELVEWVSAQHASLTGMRSIVRQLMSDAAERPDAALCAGRGPSSAAAQLRDYVVQLRRNGWIADVHAVSPAEVSAAVTMLIGAVFADAMNRDMMPEMFPQPKDETLLAYVRIFLRGLGTRPEPSRTRARTERRIPTSSSTISE